jgi:hypothetical protein
MTKIDWTDEYDNWSPDLPLSWHSVEKNKESFPEELSEQ